MEALAALADEGSGAEEREAVYVSLELGAVRGSGDEAAALCLAEDAQSDDEHKSADDAL